MITITEKAALKVREIAESESLLGQGLRLRVVGGGCAGFQYKFELAETVAADDAVAREEGVTLVVDPISLDLVRGSTVDFVESLGGAAFQVTNPNAASGCGCGTSFSI